MTEASDTAALVWALNTRLIAGATATETLLAWCEEHGLSEGPITVEIRQRFAPALVPDAVVPALELDPGETIHYRQVRLMRGSLPLAAAENWFVPQRLTAAMNEALIRTNVPFGRVIAPLQPARRTLAANPQPHAEIILVQSAVILSKARDRPGARERKLFLRPRLVCVRTIACSRGCQCEARTVRGAERGACTMTSQHDLASQAFPIPA